MQNKLNKKPFINIWFGNYEKLKDAPIEVSVGEVSDRGRLLSTTQITKFIRGFNFKIT